MGSYVLRRLVQLVPVLLGVTFLTFGLFQLAPGDPVMVILDINAPPEMVEALRHELGLDQPFLVQYGRFLWGAVRGDLGKSLRGSMSVTQELRDRFPSTLQLTCAAMAFAIAVGVGTGLLAATTSSKPIERATMLITLAGLSVPSFWLAIMLMIVFGVKLRWVDIAGAVGLKNLILPAFCLGLYPASTLARLTRSCLLEVVREDYVRTARAKGLSEWVIVSKHVLKNSLIPVVTVMGLQFGAMLGGTVFIEAVFARPGLGTFAINAIAARDYPQIQGMVVFTASAYVVINLAVDVLYRFLDPRVRLGGGGDQGA